MHTAGWEWLVCFVIFCYALPNLHAYLLVGDSVQSLSSCWCPPHPPSTLHTVAARAAEEPLIILACAIAELLRVGRHSKSSGSAHSADLASALDDLLLAVPDC